MFLFPERNKWKLLFSFHERNKWKCFSLFHYWFPLDFALRYNISVMWWEINSKQSLSTWVNQKKIKSSRKEYVMWTWFKFWPMRVWLWLVHKVTENYCRLRLFSEFIQTQKRYPSHIKLKFFLWTKLIENLLLAKYLISVAAPLRHWWFWSLFISSLRQTIGSFRLLLSNPSSPLQS